MPGVEVDRVFRLNNLVGGALFALLFHIERLAAAPMIWSCLPDATMRCITIFRTNPEVRPVPIVAFGQTAQG
jgi:hypothetical protein